MVSGGVVEDVGDVRLRKPVTTPHERSGRPLDEPSGMDACGRGCGVVGLNLTAPSSGTPSSGTLRRRRQGRIEIENAASLITVGN